MKRWNRHEKQIDKKKKKKKFSNCTFIFVVYFDKTISIYVRSVGRNFIEKSSLVIPSLTKPILGMFYVFTRMEMEVCDNGCKNTAGRLCYIFIPLPSHLILHAVVLQCSTYIRVIIINSIPKSVKQSLMKTKCKYLVFPISVLGLYRRGFPSLWDSLGF